MPEPLIERLSRFTPDASALDRDALLFAAGRASVRPSAPAWGVAVGALIASQLVTLVLFWPEREPPMATLTKPPPTTELSTADTPLAPAEPTALYTLTERALQSQNGDLPRGAAVDRLIAADPPLRASGAPSQVGLD